MFDVKQYKKDNYNFYKAHGICTYCTKERAVPGKTLCEDCLEKKRVRERKRYENNPDLKEIHKKNFQKFYYGKKEEGLCVNCGKKKAYNGSVFCYECMLRSKRVCKEYETNVRKKYCKEIGLCTRCGAERVPGRTVCAECLKKMQECIEINRKNAKKENQTFRKSIDDFWKLTKSGG